MFRKWLVLVTALFLTFLHSGGLSRQSSPSSATVPSPQSYFGFEPGAEGMLFDYEELIGYLEAVQRASARMKLVAIGTSPMGRTLYAAFLSSENNIAHLEELKETNRRLALDHAISQAARDALIENGRVFVLATLSMHSDEVGPSQAAARVAYELTTTVDPEERKWLDDVVYMMVPCHNPDGMDMTVAHYRKYKGTRYEGCSMPGVYHRYVGHDNNRDFVTLTQEDTRAISRIYSREWFPQVMVEKHEMGMRGPRYFVPPPHDPIAENVPEGIWNWIGIFGANIVKDMTADGLTGISQHYLFDDYWPGATETCIWKGVIGFLSEAASVKHATSVFVEPTELSVYGKGLSEYKKSINMPIPWSGGLWRLSDIVQYEVRSVMSIVKTASMHRQEILGFRNDLTREEVERGKTLPPAYFVLPREQHDRSELSGLVNLLTEHGVEVYRLKADWSPGQKSFRAGDIVVPLAQPFRAFVKEVLERQSYPVRHYTPGGELIKPYDVTSWSLPLHRGLTCTPVNEWSPELASSLEEIRGIFDTRQTLPPGSLEALFTADSNESYRAAFLALELGMEVGRLEKPLRVEGTMLPRGSFCVALDTATPRQIDSLLTGLSVSPLFMREKLEARKNRLERPRIGLVETFFHDMDAGWTRYIFDSYHLPYSVIRPADFEKLDLEGKFDVIVFPDVDKSVLMEGKYKADKEEEYRISDYPPEFTKGIGDKGLERIAKFLEEGGIIVSWGNSTDLFMETLSVAGSGKGKEEFQLPVEDVSQKLSDEGLYCPGSLLRAHLLGDHPLTLGMRQRTAVFYRNGPLFSTTVPQFDMDRRVIAWFPEENILASGYCEKEEKLANKAAMVWLEKGKGQLVLFGFHPQFRASTHETYKLLFNSLLL